MKKKSKQAANKLPNKIACSVCKISKGVRPDVLLKRIKDYGTLENLFEKYECQKCRKRPESIAPTAKKARKMAGADQIHPETGKRVYFWQMPGWGFTKLKPYKAQESVEQYRAAYTTTCANPKLFLDNKRFCTGCAFFEVCTCPLKRQKGESGEVVLADGQTKKLSYYTRKKLGLLKWTKKVK
jgi:hypothetical protein